MTDSGRWPVAGSLADLLQHVQEQGASAEGGGAWPPMALTGLRQWFSLQYFGSWH
jgi:hypothetical protein